MFETTRRALIITGFHRSTTSACANWLHCAGLDLGSNLMGGHISNAKGHFEDFEVVDIHNKSLQKAGTSWLFHDEVDLCEHPSSDSFKLALQNYVDKRFSVHNIWGVKDPRACLYLNDWHHVLGDSGRYLFIIRHWSSCVESLLKRHSRELAYNLPSSQSAHSILAFWRDFSLAAKMWQSYNKRVLSFVKRNPSHCMVVSHRAVSNNLSLPAIISEEFGLNVDVSCESPFDHSLYSDSAPISLKSILSIQLQCQLEQLWEGLLSVAKYTHYDEAASYDTSQDINSADLESYVYEVSQLEIEDCTLVVDEVDGSIASHVLQEISAISSSEELADYFRTNLVLGRKCRLDDLSLLVNKVRESNASDGKVCLSFAHWLQVAECWQSSIEFWSLALALDFSFPYVFNNLALCYQKLGSAVLAVHFFDKAIQGNPNNVAFYQAKAEFHKEQGDFAVAKHILECALKLSPDNVASYLLYADLLEREGETSKALDVINALAAKTGPVHVGAFNALVRLTLLVDVEKGKLLYEQQVRQRLLNKNKEKWLASLTFDLSCNVGERDLVVRCYDHWRRL